MKKIKLLLIGVMTAFCLAGCSDIAKNDTSYDVDSATGLVVLCLHKLSDSETKKTNITFIRDTYTDNIYIKCFEEDYYAGGGSMSPYYNAEGKIMKYDEFTQVHKH